MEYNFLLAKDSFYKHFNVLHLRLWYRTANEGFEIQDFVNDSSIMAKIKELDGKFLSGQQQVTWKEKLSFEPNYMNFKALVYASNQLSAYDSKFNVSVGISNKILTDFNQYYDTINTTLSNLNHIIVPFSFYNANGEKQTMLFFNIITSKRNFSRPLIIPFVLGLELLFGEQWEGYFSNKVYKEQLKTAIISILVDSFAHNISAHSLAALKWWFQLRHKMLDKRFSVPTDLLTLNPHAYFLNVEKTEITTEKYYSALGLTDSSYNKGYYSLYDFLQFADKETTAKLFSFCESVKLIGKDKGKNDEPKCTFNPRFPVPVDYALFPFFRYLRDKGAFWSGVTRDVANGGETKTWYKILWEDFINNPLYLGTIAKSEGITKINVNLAIMEKGKIHIGRFATIDLSIIEYEEELINSNELSISELGKRDQLLTISDNDSNPCLECGNEKYVENNSYSKYAFVRLGKCFTHFRKILSKDDYIAFLPSGIVGEHAIFTIFENTIRNIKHYKDEEILRNIKSNGLDLWISLDIQPLRTEVKTEVADPQLFKVGVWLAHETELAKKAEDTKEPVKVLIEKVLDSTLKSVMDDSGAPKMGGNSQDKICAAMLFNNEFKSVEHREKSRDKSYFPWISFSTSSSNDMIKEQFKLDDKYIGENSDDIRAGYLNKYLKEIGYSSENALVKGFFKKNFHVWRGADYLRVSSKKMLEGENVSRFRFSMIDVKSEETGNIILKELRQELRKNGVIRILEDDGVANTNSVNNENVEENVIPQYPQSEKVKNNVLCELYKKWLTIWLKQQKGVINLQDGVGGTIAARLAYNDNNIFYKIPDDDSTDYYDYDKQVIPFSHGSGDEEKCCNIRRHGYFWSKFFAEVTKTKPESLNSDTIMKSNNSVEQPLLFELYEILTTRILIYDNRMWERFCKLSDHKQAMYKSNLRLEICSESENNCDKFITSLNEKLHGFNGPVVLIMHLSYIESMHFKEEEVGKFLKEKLAELFKKENFIFVVTTGRGRILWRSSMDGKDEYSNILSKTIFKPIESLLNAIESGLSYNDDFDVKYNLIKIIFGS